MENSRFSRSNSMLLQFNVLGGKYRIMLIVIYGVYLIDY